jgi:hypothetical protein
MTAIHPESICSTLIGSGLPAQSLLHSLVGAREQVSAPGGADPAGDTN